MCIDKPTQKDIDDFLLIWWALINIYGARHLEYASKLSVKEFLEKAGKTNVDFDAQHRVIHYLLMEIDPPGGYLG